MKRLLLAAIAAATLIFTPAVSTSPASAEQCFTADIFGNTFDEPLWCGDQTHNGNPSGDLAAKLRAERAAAEEPSTPAPTPEPDCYVVPGEPIIKKVPVYITIFGGKVQIGWDYVQVGTEPDVTICEGDEGYNPPT